MVDEARIKRDQANERRSEAALLTIRRYESCRHQEEWIKKEASLWFDPCIDLDLMEERFLLEEKETKDLLMKAWKKKRKQKKQKPV